ncbi:MAG: hypothetical protein H7315_11240, partial [Herminiimonas sp.]|nr:hypothetical protein [Herminiimonas sp.]
MIFFLGRLIVFCFLLTALPSHAQCGVTMSCGTPPKDCDVKVCFQSATAKQQYEKQYNCKFTSKGLCGSEPLAEATQCCGKDAKSGA